MAPADTSVFTNRQNFGDLLRLQEEFARRQSDAAFARQAKQQELDIKQQMLQSGLLGGGLPAAIQIANEVQRRVSEGDVEGANLILQSAKVFDKGINPYGSPIQPQQPMAAGGGGQANTSPMISPGVIPGYGEAVGSIEATKRGMGRMAESNVDLAMKPQIQAAEEKAKLKSKTQTERELAFPQQQAKSEEMLSLLESIRNDPGLSAVVGAPNPLKGGFGAFNIPGTSAANFQAKLDQLGGKQFLEAFESLKGGGQITEVEGQKATNAIARMQKTQSEEAFLQSLDELKSVVMNAAERNRMQAGSGMMQQSAPMQPSKVRRFNPATGRIE